MKDPRHKRMGKVCWRCALTEGRYCPVGFWADKEQHAELNAGASLPDEERWRRTSTLEAKWIQEWRDARRSPHDPNTKEDGL